MAGVVGALGGLTQVAGLADDALDGLSSTLDVLSGSAGKTGGQLSALTRDFANFNRSLYEIARLTKASGSEIETLRGRLERLSGQTLQSTATLANMYRDIRSNVSAISLWNSEFDRLSKTLSKEFGSNAKEILDSITNLGERLPRVFDVISGKAALTSQLLSEMGASLSPKQFVEYTSILERSLDRQNNRIDTNIDKLRKLSDSWEDLRKSGENSIQAIGRALEPLISGALSGFKGVGTGILAPITGLIGAVGGVENGAVGSAMGTTLSALILSRLTQAGLTKTGMSGIAAGRLTGAAVGISSLAGIYESGAQYNQRGRYSPQSALTGGGLGGMGVGAVIGSGFGPAGTGIGIVAGAVVGALTSLAGAASAASRSLSEIKFTAIDRGNRQLRDLGLQDDPDLKRVEANIAKLQKAKGDYVQQYNELTDPVWSWWNRLRGIAHTGWKSPTAEVAMSRYKTADENLRKDEQLQEALVARSTAGRVAARERINAQATQFGIGSGYEQALLERLQSGGGDVGSQQAQMRAIQRRQLDQLAYTREQLGGPAGVSQLQRSAGRIGTAREQQGDRIAQQLLTNLYQLEGQTIRTTHAIADLGTSASAVALQGFGTAGEIGIRRGMLRGEAVGPRLEAERALGTRLNKGREAQSYQWFRDRNVSSNSALFMQDPEALLRDPQALSRAASSANVDLREATTRLEEIVQARRQQLELEKDYRDKLRTEDIRQLENTKALYDIDVKRAENQGAWFPKLLDMREQQVKLLEKEISLNEKRLQNKYLPIEEREGLQQRNSQLSVEAETQRRGIRMERFDKAAEYANIIANRFMLIADYARQTGGHINTQVSAIRASLLPAYKEIEAITAKMNDPSTDPTERERLRNELIQRRIELIERERSLVERVYDDTRSNLSAQKSINESILEIQDAQYRPLTEQLPVRKRILDISVEEVNQTRQLLQNLIDSNAPTEKIRDTAVKLAQEYAGVYKQVNYIRQSWMEVMTEQGMMLPGGSYTMPMGLSNWQAYGSGDYPFKRSSDRRGYGSGPGSYEYLHSGLFADAERQLGSMDIEGILSQSAQYVDDRSNVLVGGMSEAVSFFSEAVNMFAQSIGYTGFTGYVQPGRTGSEAFTEQGMNMPYVEQYVPNYRAHGGPVNAGQSYVVGERGPELFTPKTSGYVVPQGVAPLTIIQPGMTHRPSSVTTSQIAPEWDLGAWLTWGGGRGRQYGTATPVRQRPSTVAPTGRAGPNMGGSNSAGGPYMDGLMAVGNMPLGTVRIMFDARAFQAFIMQTVGNRW